MNEWTMNNGRSFEGPFIILGVVPAYPGAFDRRQKDRPPTVTVQRADHEPPAPIGGVNSDRALSRRLSTKFLEGLEALVEALRKPHTARSAARLVHFSLPSTYAMLELMRRRGFPLTYGQRGRARTFQLVPGKQIAQRGKAQRHAPRVRFEEWQLN